MEILENVPFGKYKGQRFFDVYIMDERYLRWLLSKTELNSGYMQESITYTINKLFNKDYIPVKKQKIIMPKLKQTCLESECPWEITKITYFGCEKLKSVANIIKKENTLGW